MDRMEGICALLHPTSSLHLSFFFLSPPFVPPVPEPNLLVTTAIKHGLSHLVQAGRSSETNPYISRHTY
jgi:hypothetical protein